MKAIQLKNIWEKYRIKFVHNQKVSWEELWALQDINLDLQQGETLGIIGKNGAGKTTLLKLISGTLTPDKGEINVQGRVSTLMELGAGFNPEFTGRENIVLNARMYGLDEELLKAKMPAILDFADLGKFIDAPIKYYSQGMYMRLAFALAIYVDPDILLIDDILAVGDEQAQQKCMKKIFELKQAGKTIVVVSHDAGMIARLCNRAILLDKGKIVQMGPPERIVPRYLEIVGDEKGIAILNKEKLRAVFNNGCLNISYDGINITKRMAGYVSYFIPALNAWSSSFNLEWQIKSYSSDKIAVEGSHQDGSPAQTWMLQIEKDQLQWQVELRDASIKEAHLDLLLPSGYQRWLSLRKEGAFGSFSYKYNWKEVDFGDYQDNTVGIMPDSKEKDLPFLVLKSRGEDSQFRLFNTGYEQEARVIRSSLTKDNRLSLEIKVFPSQELFEKYIQEAKDKFSIKQKQRLAQLEFSRTVSLGNLRLFADPENKSLKLYYKDKEITKDSGLYSSFLLGNIWHNVFSCDWQLNKENNNFILYLYWKQLKFTQVWRLSLQENCLFWQVDSNFSHPLKFEVLKFGLLVNPEYTRFFCGLQQGDFPGQFTCWQEMPLDNPKAELFGLRKNANLPAIVLENHRDSLCVVQNSDPSISCRSLQLSSPPQSLIEGKNCFFTKLSLFESETFIDDYFRQEQQKLLLEKEKELAQMRAQHTISSGKTTLFADVEARALRLFFEGKELTRASGLQCSCNNSKRSFGLFNAQWKIEKVSENKLNLIFRHEQFPVIQTWDLSCEEEGTLRIKAEHEVTEETFLIDEGLRLELSDEYKKWLTPSEQGDFLTDRYIGNVAPIRLKDYKVSGVIVKAKDENLAPSLTFRRYSQPESRVFNLYKRKEKNADCIGFYSAILTSHKKHLVTPGKYIYFEGKIVIGKEADLQEGADLERAITLERNELRFVFERGKSRILYKQKELTAGLGIYTSVRFQGVWHDSYQAIWHIDEQKNNKIILRGDWPHIPILQTWQIELMGRDLISWQVEMEACAELDLEIEQANLMLSSEYRSWIIPGCAQGNFLDEYTQEYDILPFRFWYGKSEKIAASAGVLPKVSFKSELKKEDIRCVAENTDNIFRARLLQYQRTNTRKLLPGKYLYFKGEIEVEPEK